MWRLPSSITGLALAVTVAASPGEGRAQAASPPAPLVRMKWQDFISGADGAKRLASLVRGIAKMKSLDNSPPASADFRRSWKYWANIHGYLGPQSKSGTVASQVERVSKPYPEAAAYLTGIGGKPGIKDQVPPDDIAKSVWATCEHSYTDPTTKKLHQANFFGWHRIYLYYFERVLRWAANDQSLALPYWDYTNPEQTGLPDAFQEPQPGVSASPLYDWRRTLGLNQGSAVIAPKMTNIDDPLTKSTAYLDYELLIERGVHGNIHCTVGQDCPISLMGLVAVAANDPIFYAHHSNIDRMWSCWSHLHPAEKPGPWASQSFSFVDENGAKVTRRVGDFLDTAKLGYVYDNDSACTRAAPVALAQAAPVARAQAIPGTANAMVSPAASKALSLNPTSTSVDVGPARTPAANRLTAAAPSASPRRTTLVLRDVTSRSSPGALLDVFVARKGAPDDRQYVATINWFAVHDGMMGMADGEASSRTFEYDIAAQLAALHLTDADEVTVTFEASSGLVPAARPADPAKLAAPAAARPAAFHPEAKLAVGAVEIR